MQHINWARLAEFFPEEDIDWKPLTISKKTNKGLAAAYLDARAIQERLDDVFGVGGWKNEYRAGPEGGVICRIYFRNDDGEWVWREDGAENTQVEAVKGGISSAFKRAGAALGIGRYLYKLPQQWVALDERGKFLQTPRVDRRYLPSGAAAPREYVNEQTGEVAGDRVPETPARPVRRTQAPRPGPGIAGYDAAPALPVAEKRPVASDADFYMPSRNWGG